MGREKEVESERKITRGIKRNGGGEREREMGMMEQIRET